MSILAIILIVVVLIVALVATFMILKQEENKMKQYEEEGDTVENELKRSHEYETKSISTNIKNLSWIYTIIIVLSFVALAVYIYI